MCPRMHAHVYTYAYTNSHACTQTGHVCTYAHVCTYTVHAYTRAHLCIHKHTGLEDEVDTLQMVQKERDDLVAAVAAVENERNGARQDLNSARAATIACDSRNSDEVALRAEVRMYVCLSVLAREF